MGMVRAGEVDSDAGGVPAEGSAGVHKNWKRERSIQSQVDRMTCGVDVCVVAVSLTVCCITTSASLGNKCWRSVVGEGRCWAWYRSRSRIKGRVISVTKRNLGPSVSKVISFFSDERTSYTNRVSSYCTNAEFLTFRLMPTDATISPSHVKPRNLPARERAAQTADG